MKANKILYMMMAGTLGLSLQGCGDAIEDFPWQIVDNNNSGNGDGGSQEGAPTLEVLEGELITGLRAMQGFQEHVYQYQRGNSIDVFAGYMGVSQNQFTFGGPLPSTYSTQAWQNYYMGPVDKSIFPALYNAYTYGEELGRPEWKALAMIAHCFVMHELADFYGPMPFDDYRNKKENPPVTYNPVEYIYNQCFKELKEAADILNERKPTKDDLQKVEGPDGGITNYDYTQWVKFANSLRLRLAMNMVKVDPVKAQQEAEAAVADGVFDCAADGSVTDQDFQYVYAANKAATHPLYFICESWDDMRLGASYENIMKRLRNPLLAIQFKKNSSAITNNQGQPSGYSANQDYVGIRQGCAMINKSSKTAGYGPFSTFSAPFYPQTIMHVTEVLFLRAEGALRGWNMGGEAKDFYERGIKRAFLAPEHMIAQSDIDKYLAQEDFDYVDYADPYNSINNIDGRVEIGVKWNESDSKELKLEKIITQKYIAIFPQSAEAWTTFRRTGYPRLLPVDPDMNAWTEDINCEVQIRRIPWYEKQSSAQADLVKAAEVLASETEFLGSTKNSPMTRIWWDIDTDEIDYGSEEGRVIPNNF